MPFLAYTLHIQGSTDRIDINYEGFMGTTRLVFNTKTVKSLPFSTTNKPDIYKDDGSAQSHKSLYLQVGRKSKSFYFVRWINGETVRHKIGNHPTITVEQARKRCKELDADADKGINPQDQKRKKRQRGITLGQAFEQYLDHARTRTDKPPIADSTEANYRRSMETHFSSWLKHPAENISYGQVGEWFREACTSSPSSANSAMRVARAVYNRQQELCRQIGADLFRINPFSGHRLVEEKPRETCIETNDLPAWFDGVNKLDNPTTRDFILTLLFTGLRKQEAARLKWCDVDLKKKTLTVRKTKNGKDHTIPLSTFLITLLETRKLEQDADYVFPGSGKSGHIADCKKAISSISKKTGIHCPPHGLRRTYSNFALYEAEIPELVRKRLLNHSVSSNDVTGRHYSVLPMERLRRYQQQITDSLLASAQQNQRTATVRSIGLVL